MAWGQITCKGVFVPLHRPIPLSQAGRVCCRSHQLEFQLVGSRKRAFSASTSTIWNVLPTEVRWASIFLAFQKNLKTRLCHIAWGSSLFEDPPPHLFHFDFLLFYLLIFICSFCFYILLVHCQSFSQREMGISKLHKNKIK